MDIDETKNKLWLFIAIEITSIKLSTTGSLDFSNTKSVWV